MAPRGNHGDTYRLNLGVTGSARLDVGDSDIPRAKFKSMPGRRDAGNRPQVSDGGSVMAVLGKNPIYSGTRVENPMGPTLRGEGEEGVWGVCGGGGNNAEHPWNVAPNRYSGSRTRRSS